MGLSIPQGQPWMIQDYQALRKPVDRRGKIKDKGFLSWSHPASAKGALSMDASFLGNPVLVGLNF